MKIAPTSASPAGESPPHSTTFGLREGPLRLAELEAAIGNTSDGVMMATHQKDENGAVEIALTFVNPAFERITGYSSAEVLGRSPRLLQGKDTDENAVEALRRVIASGTAHKVTLLNYRKDGTPFWNAMQIAPMRAENGEPSGWIGYLSDVSARVEAENALRQSQENLAAAQKLTHLGSWVMELPENSTDTPNLFWSDEVFRILGLEVGSVTPSRQFYLSLIHPDDREEAIQLEAALAAGTGFDICYRVLRPDGTARTVEVCARVEQDEQSDGAAPRRVIGTILDITERHEAETLARGANRNLQLVLQNAPIVLWALDTQGIITLIQGQSLQQLVDRAGGHVGRSIFEIYQGDAMICDLARRALTGVEAAGIVQTNGLSFDVKYSPLRDENGAFRGAVGLAHDITERRAIEAALFDSQKQLHTVIDTVPMVIWAVDAEGIYTFRQGRALEMLGQKPGEGVGQSIFEFYGQDGAKARCVRSALAGETGQELCPMRPDLVFEVHYAPSRDENGAINGVVGVSYVVTERELARRELAQSESRFNHIVANAPGMVYSFRRDLQGEISLLYVSDGCREIYGHEPDFILSHPRAVLEIVHPGNRDAFWASIDVSQQNLTPWRWEGRIERTDGEMRWVRGESRPAHQEDGSTIWDGLIIDVTKSYLSEQEALKSRRALDEAQALAHIGSFEWALESGEIRWSDEMFRLLGLDPGAFRPTLAEVFLLVVPAERDAIRRRALANLVTANADSMIVPVTRSDGQIRWLQTHARAETDAQGGSLTVVGSAQDITDSLEASRALGESEQRYALAAQGANDGLWDWNLETDRIYFSPRWKTMLGYAENEIGDRPTEWLGRIYPDDTEPFRTALSSHFARNTEHFECEYRLLNAGGAIVWMLCRALAIFDENGAAIRIVGSQTDITKRKVAEAELSRNAFYDKLTGLPNRTLFLERLENTLALARRSPEYAFAALFLDLDRFKKINDSLGHHAGDRLLVEAAARFGRCLRPGDTVARLGSDEFALLIDDVRSDEDVALVTGRIKSELEAPFIIEGKEIFVTVSIGIAPSRGSQESAEELLRNADSAMYRAKGLGRARFEIFDASMHQRALSLLELEADLWRAIERDELSLFYQPIISLESGQISGYEALIRWHHPVRGLISPADFIPIAEENGFILILGWWVLEIACHQAKAWDDLRAARFPDQKPHFMSVNLSSRQFSQPDMVEQVRTTIQRSGADPTRLTLEITESVIMEHSEVAATALRGLKKLGIHLSMDDFGTGYSSLSYLHRFSLDTLKIDRSFISQMRPGAREGEIVNTILHLAEGLNMRVVAEGVETVEQLAGLRRMGCGYAQGFLMARPMPAAQIEALWNTAPSW